MMPECSLPIQHAGRVVVSKGGYICLGEVRSEDGTLRFYNLPGGCVEPGESMEEACRRETKEEVGFDIANIRPLGMEVYQDYAPSNEKYCGVRNVYYQATFSGPDNSIYGADGDTMAFTWLSPEKALQALKDGPDSPFNEPISKAIGRYAKTLPRVSTAIAW